MKLTNQRRVVLTYSVLCLLSFCLFFIGSSNSFQTSTITAIFELLAVLTIGVSFRFRSIFLWYSRKSTVIRSTAAVFVVLVTISLIFSPLGLLSENLAIARYLQTMCHLLFFGATYYFFSNAFEEKWLSNLYLSIAVAGSALALVLVATWNLHPEVQERNWFTNPPLGAHLRHLGYLVTASSIAAIVLLILGSGSNNKRFIIAFTSVFCVGFLFWTGGRSAIGSVLCCWLILLIYRRLIGSPLIRGIGWSALVFVLGAIISRAFTVFDWNGVTQGITRSVPAESAPAVLSGRVEIWQNVIAALDGHWLLGLGPQGYYFIPDRIFGVQPHSMLLQFLTEWGVLGTLLFLSLMLAGMRFSIEIILRKARDSSVSVLCASGVFVALTLHGIVDGTYFHGQPSFLIALSYAVMLAFSETQLEKEASDHKQEHP